MTRGTLTAALALLIALPAAAQRPDTAGMRMGGRHRGMQSGQPGMSGMGQDSTSGRRMRGGGQGGGAMGGMEMGMGMMGTVAGFAPDRLLERRDALELTVEQVERLTALRDAAAKAGDDAHRPAHAAMQALRTELDRTAPDTAKVHAYLNAHEIAMGNVLWVRIKAALEARALLSEVQRQRVEP